MGVLRLNGMSVSIVCDSHPPAAEHRRGRDDDLDFMPINPHGHHCNSKEWNCRTSRGAAQPVVLTGWQLEHIKVDIEERFSKDIVSMVREGVVSLGVCWSNIDFGGLEHWPYRRDKLTLAVPMNHPLAQHEALHFEDSLVYDHVGLPPSTAVHTMLGRAAAKVGRHMSYRVVVSNFDVAFRVVAAGLGISVVPREVSEIYVSAGQVRIIPLLNDWAHREFAICYRRHGDLTPAAERLLEFLGEQAASEARGMGEASVAWRQASREVL
jgi:DNA-binding transcriptional LysR family regulator